MQDKLQKPLFLNIQKIIKKKETYQIYIPITVLPEVDYLVTKYLGERVVRSFLEDLADGYFTFLTVELEAIDKIVKLMKRYKDLPLGFVDASLVILAESHQIKQILTLDRRHFNLIQSERLKFLEILP
jgi:hypothetical protein